MGNGPSQDEADKVENSVSCDNLFVNEYIYVELATRERYTLIIITSNEIIEWSDWGDIESPVTASRILSPLIVIKWRLDNDLPTFTVFPSHSFFEQPQKPSF